MTSGLKVEGVCLVVLVPSSVAAFMSWLTKQDHNDISRTTHIIIDIHPQVCTKFCERKKFFWQDSKTR